MTVDGQDNPSAAWFYPKPSPLARRIKNHVAFWNGVQIEGEAQDSRPPFGERIAAWLVKP